MGLLDAVRKMMQGKPVFEDPAKPDEIPGRTDTVVTNEQTMPTTPPPVKKPVTSPQSARVIPTFDLRHCKTTINGNTIEVTIWVTNTSTVDIEIKKCVILDTTTLIDRRFSPGQAHEIRLYRGPVPTTDHAHKANIFYRAIRENEYFRVDFMVEYNRESNGIFTVEDLHPEHYAVKEFNWL